MERKNTSSFCHEYFFPSDPDPPNSTNKEPCESSEHARIHGDSEEEGTHTLERIRELLSLLGETDAAQGLVREEEKKHAREHLEKLVGDEKVKKCSN